MSSVKSACAASASAGEGNTPRTGSAAAHLQRCWHGLIGLVGSSMSNEKPQTCSQGVWHYNAEENNTADPSTGPGVRVEVKC
ncbi:hypothetical protein SKAU_G00005350 [Synaphobranchus kaupii]|uniref:Uncharacterized protein n=1 Tax=Synaphobranchus kaupii TaxID=118154 RepID=A0A9Q1GAQ2_SYNKA|nr:hypothetical protein SKAU_G00005350 [Synaphobranchus kaupii]